VGNCREGGKPTLSHIYSGRGGRKTKSGKKGSHITVWEEAPKEELGDFFGKMGESRGKLKGDRKP